MMTQLGNASRLKRSEVNISIAATADSGLTFHRLEEQRQVIQGDAFMLGWGGEQEENTAPGILKMKRPVPVGKHT